MTIDHPSAASRGRTPEPARVEPRVGQVWRPWEKARRGRLITITAVHPGYVIGLSSPATGRGNTVRVRIPAHRLREYQFVEDAPDART